MYFIPECVIFKFLPRSYCCRSETKLDILFQNKPSPVNSPVCINIEKEINLEMLITSYLPASETMITTIKVFQSSTIPDCS